MRASPDPKVVFVGVERPLYVREEAVPQGGLQLTRRWQRSRGSDGRVHLWMARQKRPGRGDRASGLQFDRIDWTSSDGGSGEP